MAMKPTSLSNVERFVHQHGLYWYAVTPDGLPAVAETKFGTTWMLFQTEAKLQAVLGTLGPVASRRLPPQAVKEAIRLVLNDPKGVEVVVGQLDLSYVVVRLTEDA